MVIDRFVDPPGDGVQGPGFLVGRCALVTGGARRIGRVLVESLAAAGATVVIHYRTSEAEARAAVAAVEARGAEAYTLQADLASSDLDMQLVDEAAKLAGQPIDILVNNASVFEPQDVLTTTVADFDRNIAVNLRAPFLLARGLARQLPRGAVGDVVNLNDDQALRPPADHFAYTVSKAGLHGMTRSLALALAPRVKVNELALGAVMAPETPSGEYLRTRREDLPLERFGTPADAAHALMFLLGNPAVTGQTILINGGRHLR